MKKAHYILLLLLFCSATSFSQIINPDWEHVGPKSENQQNGNLFWPAQINRIAVDPSNSAHYFVAGRFGGLWETTNSGTLWENINTIPMGSNGSCAITFKTNNELFVGDFFH